MLKSLSSPVRNLVYGLLFMVVVSACATLAYMAYMAYGRSFTDAIYMVLLTVYTVGYGEVRPIDTPGLREVTIALMVFGCTGMIFLTGTIVQLFTFSQFQFIFGGRRMQKNIDGLQDHVIICGYGRIGLRLAQELHDAGTPFVVIERGDALLASLKSGGMLTIQGDATDEDVLKLAGITRARALATVLPNDAANVFITLSARSLNKGLVIIARGEAPSTEEKLTQAGADRVVLPTHIGAERIAELILFRETADLRASSQTGFVLRHLGRLGLDYEILPAAVGSRAVGASLGAVEAMAAGAFMIFALERNGETLMQPSRDIAIEAGNGVAIIGRGPRRAPAGDFLASLLKRSGLERAMLECRGVVLATIRPDTLDVGYFPT